MADDYVVRDANGASKTMAAKDVGGGKLAPQSVPSSADGTPISAANPLPTTPVLAASGVAAVTGSLSANGSSNAFTPQLGRPIMVTTSGSWIGTVQLLRSTDAGATKLPLTVGGAVWGAFTANCNEPVWVETEAGATFYLDFVRSSGTLTYRIAQ